MIAELSTQRLTLRPPHMEDVAAIASGLDNFNVTRFLTKVPFPYTEQDARDWLVSLSEAPPEHQAFAVTRDDAGLIGVVGLENELGYWLAEPHWGRGYATEAAAAALAWYFGATDADTITSGAHFDNPASLNVQRKLGFEITGRETRFAVSRGKEIEHIATRLTRSAFEEKGYLS